MRLFNFHYYVRLGDLPPPDVNPLGVFANNELDLSDVEVYGFDYDYTLAVYKESLHYLIYDLGRDWLINKFKVKTNCFCYCTIVLLETSFK